jgi:hypothetical protein
MMLFERAVKATVALKAMQETTASNELLDRGERVAEDLERTGRILSDAFLLANQFGARPTLDLAALKKAMTQLEKGLTKGLEALQHVSTTNGVGRANDMARSVELWALSAWKQMFSTLLPTLKRGQSAQGDFVDLERVRIERKVIENAIATNPLTDAKSIFTQIEVDDIEAAAARIRERVEEFDRSIDRLERKHEAMSEAVRLIISNAQSPTGVPLTEFTPEIIQQLETAGVIGRFTVRIL